jgi:hypothetical protein
MKKLNHIIFVFFVLSFKSLELFAQNDGPAALPDWLTNPGWEYYSDNMLSTVSAGKGNTGIAGLGDLTTLTLNPASININNKYQVYIGASFKTDVTLPYTYHQTLSNSFPSCIIGGIYKINKNLQTGFVYRNDFTFQNEYILSSITGDNIINKFITHNFTVPVVFNYKWLSAGVNLNITYFWGEAKGTFSNEIQPEGYYDETHSKLWRFIPQFGAIVSPVKEFSLGLTITPGFNDSTAWHRDMSSNTELKSPVKYPWRLGIGGELRLLKERLKLTLDYHFEKKSVLPGFKDKSNFNFGVEYQAKEYLTVRGGFFTLLDFRDNATAITTGDEIDYDQYFLTLGGTLKYKGYSFNLALMDSHFTSKSSVYHTKINGGISLDF